MPAEDGGTVNGLSTLAEIPEERLCTLLTEAGLPHESDAVLAREDKVKLLLYLRSRRGNDNREIEPSRIALKRRKHDELRVNVGGQRGPRNMPVRQRTVIIEERRTRHYKRRGITPQDVSPQVTSVTVPVEDVEIVPEVSPAETQAQAGQIVPPVEIAMKKTVAKIVEKDLSESELPHQGKEAPVLPPDTKREPVIASSGKPEKLHVAPEMAAKRRKKKRIKSVATRAEKQHTFQRPVSPVVHEVEVPESISVSDLAQRMSVKAQDVIRVLMGYGTMVTINQILDQETAKVVVDDLGHRAMLIKSSSLEEQIGQARQTDATAVVDLASRPPVVTVMGHVDHGKTTLLDRIRKSSMAAEEKGGITQHIGAYTVDTPRGSITFLDTPGHEAFTAMRARGAKVTDLVVLVVAADDGVMPQTREAIKHARAAGVPVIVALNKIDRPDAQPERVAQELASEGLTPEEWGGDSLFVNVSAQTGDGIDKLLEALHLQAEILELRAPQTGMVTGTVLESRIDRTRGAVATVLVQSGQLNKGDMLLSGAEYGRVRQLLDQNNQSIGAAGPSTPVEIIGLTGAPAVGDLISGIPDERTARDLAEKGKLQAREEALQKRLTLRSTPDDVFAQIDDVPGKLHVIVKADVQGTEQALVAALQELFKGDAAVSVISHNIGGINESDVNLAKTCRGLILGFNVRADATARKLADEEGLQIRYYSVIYELLDDVEKMLTGMATPEERDQVLGMAEVREVFRSPKLGNVAGCMVTSGQLRRNAKIRVLRDNMVIYEGELESLRRFKDDVTEVKAGIECGVGVKNYDDVKVGDHIEVYERVMQPSAN